MPILKSLKRWLTKSTVATLTACMTLSSIVSPIASAYAESTGSGSDTTSSDPIVGSLSLVSMFDPEHSAITGGHSFVLFTSYTDGLELNFTDLYGHYEMTDEFKATTEADASQLSWKANFDDFAAKDGSNISLADYLKYTEDARKNAAFEYHSLWQAIFDYGDTCFKYTPGDAQTDKRYRKTSYTTTLNAGEYITVGSYVSASSMYEMLEYAVTDSTAYKELVRIIDEHITGSAARETIIKQLEAYLTQYVRNEITYDELVTSIKTYMGQVLTETGLEAFLLFLGSYTNRVNILDGDAVGGVYVNRELWRQKVYQTFSPNVVYSIDITQSQLDRMLAFYNSGTANHYSMLAYNCTAVSTGAWNAAVGTDADGNKTALYADAKDDSIQGLDGFFDTPKKLYQVIKSWEGKDLGGKFETWDLVHGVSVPQYTVTYDAGDGASTVDSQTVAFGKLATAPADPTREGYTFKGWQLSGEAYDFATPVTGDITLTALWEKNAEPTPDPDPEPTPEPDPEPTPDPEPDTKPSKKSDGSLPATGDASYLVAAPLAVLGAAALVIARRRLS